MSLCSQKGCKFEIVTSVLECMQACYQLVEGRLRLAIVPLVSSNVLAVLIKVSLSIFIGHSYSFNVDSSAALAQLL